MRLGSTWCTAGYMAANNDTVATVRKFAYIEMSPPANDHSALPDDNGLINEASIVYA
jgi:hypothetical protein